MDFFHLLLLFLSNSNYNNNSNYNHLPVFSVKSPIISIGPFPVFVNCPFMKNVRSR